jgi:hypothetical protein
MERKKWYKFSWCTSLLKRCYFALGNIVIFFLIIFIVFESYAVYKKINIHSYFCKKNKILKEQVEEKDKIVHVELYKVSKEERNIVYNTYGTVIGAYEAQIIFEHGGEVVYISNNRKIKKGDLIIALDTSGEQAKKKSIEFALDIKKKKLDRTSQLVKNNILSLSDVEQIKIEISELEGRLVELDTKIKQMSIYALEDGYFYFNNTIVIGSNLQPRQHVGMFFSEKKFIKCFIPHEFLRYLTEEADKPKKEEKLTVLFFPEYNSSSEPLKGHLNISLESLRPLSAAENEHKNALCEGWAVLEDNNIPPYFLNQSGKVNIKFNSKESYISVPEIAVFNRGIKHFVYVIQDGIALLTEVEIMGPAESGNFKVKSPLSDGDVIVLRGINQVTHMGKVKGKI